ncbi:MAG: hypothetical protein AAF703_03800 [Cyanobacteria bacterium P01_D01_bin.105]
MNIKAKYFFTPMWWMRALPLRRIEQLRDEMHDDLMKLSTHCTQLNAEESSHFVWTDQPEIIVQAVHRLLSSSG